jgi:hypothetical protein
VEIRIIFASSRNKLRLLILPEPYLSLKQIEIPIRVRSQTEKEPSAAAAAFKTMELIMLGTIVIRTLLVIALICMAHTIKPFSVKSVSQHLLYSTRSFAFVLPEQTRASFDNASYLALSLSDSLFRENREERNGNGDEGLMLAAQSSQDSLRPALKVWPPDESIKPSRKPKPGPKRSAPSKRLDRGDRNENMNVAAVVSTNELTNKPANWNSEETIVAVNSTSDAEPVIAVPVSLPVIPEEIVQHHALSLGFLFSMEGAGKNGCSEQEFKLLKLATEIEVLKSPRIVLLRAEKPKTSAPECEGQKPDGGEAEVIAPEVEAPEPPEPAEPESHEAEEAPNEERPSPLKCPTEPEI